MKQSMTEGLTLTRRIQVDTPRTIGFMGDACRVYATPELVRDIEMTARDLLLEHCDAGEDSVGTRVAIDHIAATPLGMWVDVSVTISALQGRMVTLKVECSDACEPVARGEHMRFVVDTAKTAERLSAKAAKVA